MRRLRWRLAIGDDQSLWSARNYWSRETAHKQQEQKKVTCFLSFEAPNYESFPSTFTADIGSLYAL